ncbi:MAG: thioredoxin [Lachnospiraceae bacterium]|nr:thioredoxin [Lachnospiraceae bacterium]
MAKVTITTDNFEAEVLKAKEPVLVDFWATWCGPCRMLSPLVDQIANEAEGFKVGAIDVDANGELAARYGVSAIPTLIVFKNGEVAAQSVGFIPKDQILALVQNA